MLQHDILDEFFRINGVRYKHSWGRSNDHIEFHHLLILDEIGCTELVIEFQEWSSRGDCLGDLDNALLVDANFREDRIIQVIDFADPTTFDLLLKNIKKHLAQSEV